MGRKRHPYACTLERKASYSWSTMNEVEVKCLVQANISGLDLTTKMYDTTDI